MKVFIIIIQTSNGETITGLGCAKTKYELTILIKKKFYNMKNYKIAILDYLVFYKDTRVLFDFYINLDKLSLNDKRKLKNYISVSAMVLNDSVSIERTKEIGQVVEFTGLTQNVSKNVIPCINVLLKVRTCSDKIITKKYASSSLTII